MPESLSIINRFSIVKQIPIFSKLNWFNLQKIVRKAKIVEYKKGEIIYQQGDPADAFYCLVSGRLQAYTLNPNGTKENVDLINRGKHFGIISLLTKKDHSLNFVAVNDSIVLKIEKEDFYAILNDIPHLGVELSQSLSQRLRKNVIKPKHIFESTAISVYSPTRGAGSSTYSINLALGLNNETGKKVIFIDLNPKGKVALHPNQDMAEATPNWKKQGVDLKQVVDDYDKVREHIHREGLPIDLLNVEFDIEDASLIKKMGKFISTLTDEYHYVVVDLPNEMDDVVLEILVQSDLVHLIMLEDRQNFDLIKHVVKQLQYSLKENFKEEKVKVLVSGVQSLSYLSYQEIDRCIDYPVHLKLPHFSPESLKAAVVSEVMTVINAEDESAYAKTIKRIARTIGGVRIGLALGGGAALGIAHIGVLRVLEREKIPVDIVIGSSMGALIGSLWVTGRDSNNIEVVAKQFSNYNNILKLLDLVVPVSGLIGGKAIQRWLRRQLGDTTFQATKIPFKAIAYDLIRREEMVIDKGTLVNAVRRSISIPGVIEPIREQDRVIIDGGVLNPLPTSVLTALGVKKIIAVNVLQSPEDVSKGYDLYKEELEKKLSIPFIKAPWMYIALRLKQFLIKVFFPNISDIIVRSLLATEYHISEQSAQHADVVIHPDLVGINWFELYRVEEIIRQGEEAALEALDSIKVLIGDET